MQPVNVYSQEKQPTDEQLELDRLILRCKKGDPQAFDELVKRYSNRCYAYFYRLTGRPDQSEELLSELFVRLVRKIRSYVDGSFEKWMFTIASNLFKDSLRKQYRQKRLLEEKAELLAQNEGSPRQCPELFDKLQLAMEKLDRETAEILNLRYYSQMSFKELAEARKEPIGTTLSKVHRGLKKLRMIMDEL
ncbi:MAG: sigma-70 family RNA polymerase sigma factor [Planctomycetaceae bacterium]|nr:sigma-70 family RNA polymerase sigma factor [Planctomycetaceae bacterium]